MNPNTSPQANDPMAGFSDFAKSYKGPQVIADMPGGTPQTTPMAQPQPSTPQNPLDFLTENADTIGGIAGGILGGIGGGALDVATGGAATPFINPVTGAVAGAGLFGGVGQEVKNLTHPTESMNPFLSGAEQAGSELIGQGAGKLFEMAAPVLKNTANDLFRSAFNTGSKYMQRLNVDGTISKVLDYGMGGSLRNMMTKSKSAMDMLDPLYRQAVGGIEETIDTTGASKAAGRVLNQLSTTDLTQADKQTVISNLDKFLFNSEKHMNLDPQTAVDNMRQLQNAGHQLLSAGENKIAPGARRNSLMGEAYLAAGDELQHALDDASTSTGVDALKTDANKQLLGGVSKKLATDFNNAKTPQEIRSLMAPFYNLNKMAQHTLTNPRSARLLSTMLGGAGGMAIGGPMGALAGGVIAAPVLEGVERTVQAPLATGAANIVNKAANMGEKFAQTQIIPALGMSGNDLIGKSIGLGSAPAIASAATANGLTPPVNTQGPQQPPQLGGVSSLVNSAVSSSIPQQTQGLPVLNLQEYQQLLNAVGQRGVDNYLSVQRQENPIFTQDQQTAWMENQNAVNEVQQFAKNFENTWAKGAGIGALQELGTNIPLIQNLPGESNLKAYNDAKGDLAQTIGKILGGGRASNASVQQMMQELPDVNDSPTAAAMKLSNIVSLLGQSMNTIMSAPSTNVPGIANFTGQMVPGSMPSLPISPPLSLSGQ